jgi:hypothetical protein
MSASTATADTPLRPTWLPVARTQAGGLAPHGLTVLLQVRLGPSGLRTPVSVALPTLPHSMGEGRVGVSRTGMNNVG